MLLKGLAHGPAIHVYAACSSSGICQVVETLMEWREQFPDAFLRMFALIYDYTPTKGVPDKTHFKQLYYEIFEFRETHFEDERRMARQAEALRVACFFENPAVLICTNAFLKTRTTGLRRGARFATPQFEIDEAMRVRTEFHHARMAGTVELL